MSEEHVARVVATAARRFDLTAAWAGVDAGREGWELEPGQTARASRIATEVAEAAVSSLDIAARANVEIVAATFNGTGHLAELMHEQIRDAGPKWVAPETFLYYSPQSIASAVALGLSLGGPTTTLLGPRAGAQALAQAVRRIRSGRAQSVLVLGYEMLSRFATQIARDHGHRCPDAEGGVVAIMVSGDGVRGGPALTVQLGTGLPGETPSRYAGVWAADPPSPAEWRVEPPASPATATLHAVADATAPAIVVSGGTDRYDLVVMTP